MDCASSNKSTHFCRHLWILTRCSSHINSFATFHIVIAESSTRSTSFTRLAAIMHCSQSLTARQRASTSRTFCCLVVSNIFVLGSSILMLQATQTSSSAFDKSTIIRARPAGTWNLSKRAFIALARGQHSAAQAARSAVASSANFCGFRELPPPLSLSFLSVWSFPFKASRASTILCSVSTLLQTLTSSSSALSLGIPPFRMKNAAPVMGLPRYFSASVRTAPCGAGVFRTKCARALSTSMRS
mmetsp:Transcript_17122/g.31702  ORF Transcript_17122/g.31702 Transcript_17122/m.31702 type:complete len:243 (-) Transcript_17122:182-910(-)